MRYLLPRWVHVAFTTDGAIFLDLRRDRYIGLDLSKASTLRRMLDDASSPAGDANEVASELMAQGLLRMGMGDAQTRPLAATLGEHPDSLLLDTIDELPPRFRVLHVARFVMACATVWLWLHLGSLERVVRYLQIRKQRLPRTAERLDRGEIDDLVRVFVNLRTFVYTAREHCLYDSLVLFDFLRRFGVAATCIFGVRTLPFGAHCWVQIDRRLATEVSIEEISAFKPIFVM